MKVQLHGVTDITHEDFFRPATDSCPAYALRTYTVKTVNGENLVIDLFLEKGFPHENPEG